MISLIKTLGKAESCELTRYITVPMRRDWCRAERGNEMSIRIIPLIVGLAVLLSGYHVENTAIHLEGSRKHIGKMAVKNTFVEDAML